MGPKDLLRAMGYTELGKQLPPGRWKPGDKEDDTPCWVKPDGRLAPLCPYPIPMVAGTGNAVTPFVGCERFEDLGPVVRFFQPYVFIGKVLHCDLQLPVSCLPSAPACRVLRLARPLKTRESTAGKAVVPLDGRHPDRRHRDLHGQALRPHAADDV